MGLQHKTLAQIEKELQLPQQQILAQFNKMCRKIVTKLREIETDYMLKHEDEAQKQLQQKPKQSFLQSSFAPLNKFIDNSKSSSKDNGVELTEEQKERQKQVQLDTALLQQYAISVNDEQWERELNGVERSGIVSIKTDKTDADESYKIRKKSSKKKEKRKITDSSNHKSKKQKH